MTVLSVDPAMKFAKIITLLISLMAVLPAPGQDIADFTTQHYTSDNGLPQNSVMLLRKDKNGFIWMTTQGGLVRFDGTHFATYNLSNTPQLTTNRIIDLGLTGDSSVYFKDTGFKVISFDENNRPYVLNQRLRNRAVVLRSQKNQFDVIQNLRPADRQALQSLFGTFATDWKYYQIGRLGDGFLSIGEGHLFYLSQKKVVFRKIFDYPALFFDKAGLLNNRMYIVEPNGHILCIDSTGREYTALPRIMGGGIAKFGKDTHLYQQGNRLFLRNINTFYELIAGSAAAGAPAAADPAKGGRELLCKPVLKTGDIGGTACYLNIPESGIHVVGTLTNGVYIFRKKQFQTVRIPGTNNNFYSQHLYKNTGLLTDHGAILPTGIITGDPFPLYSRTGILVDRNGNVWMHRVPKYLEQRDPDLKWIRSVFIESPFGKFAQTADGSIWVNLAAGKLGKVIGDSVRWLNLAKKVQTFHPVNNTEFWTSDGKGLFLTNVENATSREVPEMAGREVRAYYLDKRQTLWAGTYGQGFYAVRNGKATALPLDRNGHLLAVHTFLEDKKGFMWMTTNHGLFKCKTQDLYDYLDGKASSVFYYYYDKSNGFTNNEFNGGCDPSSVVFPDGKFSFPSMEGLVQVYPDSIVDILPNSRILIDKFVVDGEQQPFSTALRLPPSFNRIEVTLASPYFGLPENQYLEYNIKGLDDEWYPVNSNLTITLNRLSYGNYTLQVRKKAGFGYNNVNVLVKNLTVDPFWYQTWYALLFALCVLAFSFYVVVKLRYHYLTQRKKQLEAQVRERTRQLEYSNRLKEKITLLLAHDLQSPLHFLNLLSDHVTAALEKERFEDVKNGTAEIKKAATNIHAFVKEINLWTKSQQEGFFLSKRPFPFDGLADELREFFKEMLLLKNNTLEFVNPGGWELFTNREILKAVIRNLIDNSNKYTTGGHIRVELNRLDEKHLRLSISDNGRGMSPADLSKINRRIENVLTTAGIEQSGRLGYQIIIDFVARLECKLEVNSIVGQGTTVTISGLLPGQANTTDAILEDIAPTDFTTL
ncbi:signal transduction histidine kinase [Dyadobacter sp. BE34]|uniref:Signal transduction histidine kinase n=2 Tax=Dyadobacter TaxID=120831 RepID=A0ABU1QZS6_9BACT|nr:MULTISPECIES: ATP-binding protein [Dyadobacter]MDR7216675.1 signal transduction histidine kinase [Dyadobacter sp. BE31]MDR7263799.1 signal transduction histidine kinase [Dyadobacter sp. BE32]MDR6806661.1 signal transduction histidine kinase [Dyadobacter fermentans]MDR7044403.1 signal transduction histidine kinase [Dyadobacter sp. BE242]MDR7198713.1 signal transduction histidine kinase [Dyadobacter sp. BE34]